MIPQRSGKRKSKHIHIQTPLSAGAPASGTLTLGAQHMAPPEERMLRARRNMRRHVVRASIRVGALLASDAVAVVTLSMVARAAMRFVPQPLDGAALAGVELLTSGMGASFFLALVLAMALSGGYRTADHWWRVPAILNAAIIAGAIQLWSAARPVTAAGVLGAGLVVLLLAGALWACRHVLHLLEMRIAPFGRPTMRAVLVGPLADCIAAWGGRALSDPRTFTVAGVVTTDAVTADDTLGTLEELHRIVHREDVDTVILCGDAHEGDAFTRVVQSVLAAECRVLALPRVLEAPELRPRMMRRGRRHFIELRAPAGRWQQFVLKRAFDIIGSLILLVLLAPVLLGIALLVRIDSRGPILFGHTRYGHAGRRFRMLKFRSMRPDAERILEEHPELYEKFLANDCKLPEHEDPRITRIGRWLRKTSLDELPQLINVLMGDMSLVGPRPVVEAELHFYDNWLLTVQAMKPGMTGWWQVNGRSSVSWPYRAELDVYYAVNWSFALDLRILALTVPAVVSQRGAF